MYVYTHVYTRDFDIQKKGSEKAVSNYRVFWDHIGYGHDSDKMVTLMDKRRTSWAWWSWYTSRPKWVIWLEKQEGLLRGRSSSRSRGNGACNILCQSSLTDTNDISLGCSHSSPSPHLSESQQKFMLLPLKQGIKKDIWYLSSICK